MHRRLQERLVGAVVLVLAAVLILPAVLSGPPATEADRPVDVAGEPPQRSQTIRLDVPQPARDTAAPSDPPASGTVADVPAAAEGAATGADPRTAASETPPLPAAEPPTESVAARAQEPAPAKPEPAPEPKPAAKTEPARESVAEPDRRPAAAPPPSARAAAPAPATGAGWAVQVGNFASKANADRLTATLARAGHAAFVMPRTNAGNTTYRVRVGPVSSLDEARAVERKLESEGHPADVVRHP